MGSMCVTRWSGKNSEQKNGLNRHSRESQVVGVERKVDSHFRPTHPQRLLCHYHNYKNVPLSQSIVIIIVSLGKLCFNFENFQRS